MDVDILDRHLKNALVHLRDSPLDSKGPVAAGLVSGERVVYAVSKRMGDRWLHAERSALRKFREVYGGLPWDASMVVSLSPCCSEELPRHGISCTRLLNGEDGDYPLEVERLHVGILDEREASYSDYVESGFDITRTDSQKLRELCRRLNDFFDIDDPKINAAEHVERVLETL